MTSEEKAGAVVIAVVVLVLTGFMLYQGAPFWTIIAAWVILIGVGMFVLASASIIIHFFSKKNGEK